MLGAGLVRLAALVAVDGVVVAIGAAAVAVPLSWWLSRLLFSTMWTRLTPTTMDVSPDAGVLAAVGGLGLLVGVLVSLPAVLLVYRRGRGAMVPGRTIVHGASRLQRGLIVGQVAVSLVLLLCAALFTRNLVTLRQIDPGYDADALRWTRLELGYGQPRAIDQVTYFRPILDQLEALPAVARAALSVSFPTTERRHVAALGAVRRAGAAPDDPGVPSDLEYASPGFFDALGVRVLEGRAFDWSDVEGREPVAVVNRTLADRLFPDGAVLGASVASSGAGQAQQARVVGIVADSSPGDVRIGALPVLYLPLFQNPRTAATPRVVLRVAPDPGLDEAVRTRIEAAGRHRVSGLETIRVQANRFFMRERVLAGLAAAFAGLSVLVSGLGLYGLLAQVALARTRESGVRAALGATPPQVASRVIREGLGPVLVGIAVGLPLAFIAARAATVLLWDLRATDPISYVAAVLVLLITAAVSCARPALRTARIAPVDALRQD
jgi:predicted permease